MNLWAISRHDALLFGDFSGIGCYCEVVILGDMVWGGGYSMSADGSVYTLAHI